MEIYADVLFFVNFISTYIILDLTQRMTGYKCKVKKKCMAAAAGGVFAVLAICFSEAGALIRLTGFILIPAAMFGFNKMRIIIFCAMSAAMSAVFVAIESFTKYNEIYVSDGIIYFDIPLVRFAVIFALSYAAVCAAQYFIRRFRSKSYHDLEVGLGGRYVRLRAFVDSGNRLREPVSKSPVIVTEWRYVKALFSDISYDEFVNGIERYRVRLVPYYTVGSGRRLMCAFKADSVRIRDENRERENVYIGIAALDGRKDYNALIGVSV